MKAKTKMEQQSAMRWILGVCFPLAIGLIACNDFEDSYPENHRTDEFAIDDRAPETQTAREMKDSINEENRNPAETSPNGLRRLEGEIRITVIDDFEAGKATTITELIEDGSNRSVRLDLGKNRLEGITTGDRVSVTGKTRATEDLFGVESWFLTAKGGNGKGKPGDDDGGDGGGPRVSGPRTTAVILINLLDSDCYLTRQQAIDHMWGDTNSVDDLFNWTSRGEIHFVSDGNNDGQIDVFGPYDLPETGAGQCPYPSWASQARAMAEAEGYDLTGFDHYVYVMPAENSCLGGGWALAGGGDTVYINNALMNTIAHEIGHNFGMWHASADPDNDGVIDAAYGGHSCLMGGVSSSDLGLNAPHLEFMGWLPDGVVVDDAGEVGTRTYTIWPLMADEQAIPGTRVVKIPHKLDGDSYYISFRDHTGYDANLFSKFHTGVTIHRAAGTGTRLIGTLLDGETLVDDMNGITIEQIGLAPDGSSVDVSVTFSCGNGVCDVGEDCQTCAEDCIGLWTDFECGNGVCEDGEDCYSCADDCASKLSGSPRTHFCCVGGPVGYSDITIEKGVPCTRFHCTTAPYSCSSERKELLHCCGDGMCSGPDENSNTCGVDCN